MQAIHLTVPNFDLEEINQHLYTFDEVKAIVQIANVYSDFGQNEKAADIFSQLLKYVRKHYQEIITSSGLFPMILFNYARVLDLCGRYKEGKQLAEEGKMFAYNMANIKPSLDVLKSTLNAVTSWEKTMRVQKHIVKLIISVK